MTPRHAPLDALRALALLEVILFHIALSFTYNPTLQRWPVHDLVRSPLIDDLIRLPRPMEMFFVMGGFFARLLYMRHGLRGFVAHRAQRLLLPFVIGVLTVGTLTSALWSVGGVLLGWGGAQHNVARLVRGYYASGRWWRELNTAHLWFIYYLLWMYAVALIGSRAFAALDGERWLGHVDRGLGWLLRRSWKPLVLALPAALLLLQLPHWRPHAAASLWLEPAVFAYYLLWFTFGWFLQRQPERLEELARDAWRNSALTLLLAPVLLHYIKLEFAPDLSLHPEWRAQAMFVSSAFAWFTVFALIGLFVRHVRAPIAWIRYLSDAAYFVYLAHVPLVLYLQVRFAHAHLPLVIKFGAISLLSLGVLLGLYQLAVRRTIIGRVLNGPVQVRAEPAPAAREAALS